MPKPGASDSAPLPDERPKSAKRNITTDLERAIQDAVAQVCADPSYVALAGKKRARETVEDTLSIDPSSLDNNIPSDEPSSSSTKKKKKKKKETAVEPAPELPTTIAPTTLHDVPSPSLFQFMPGLDLNTLALFNSNTDLLAAIQNLTFPTTTTTAPDLPASHPTPTPAPRKIVPKKPKPSTSAPLTSTVPPPVPILDPSATSAHADLLATKWLNASKLAELVASEGLVYKKGKFSAIEEGLLNDAIEKYRAEKGLTQEDMNEVVFAKGKKGKDDYGFFWITITRAVPLRPIIAVYHHVRRTYHPMRAQGKWTIEEDDNLRSAVLDLGQRWEEVSTRVGRMSADCRDRYRNHIVNRELRVSGAWSLEEEEELTKIVTELTVDVGKDPDNDVFWGEVSKRMGNRRTRQQCRIKWTDALSKKLKNSGERPRWSQQDAFILVHKIASLQINDDSEIDWKLFADPDWNIWSAHQLQRRWQTLKKSVKDWDQLPFRDIIEILKQKKSHLPSGNRHRQQAQAGSSSSNPAALLKRTHLSEPIVSDKHLQDDETAVVPHLAAIGTVGGGIQNTIGGIQDAVVVGLPDFVEFGHDAGTTAGGNGIGVDQDEDEDEDDQVNAAAQELLNPAYTGADSTDEDDEDDDDDD